MVKTYPVVQKTTLAKIYDETAYLARCASFFHALWLIDEKAREMGVDPEKIEIKPQKIKEYIKSTSDVFQRELLREYGIFVEYSEEKEMKENLKTGDSDE